MHKSHRSHSVEHTKRIKLNSDVINIEGEVSNNSDCIINVDQNSYGNCPEQSILYSSDKNKIVSKGVNILNSTPLNMNINEIFLTDENKEEKTEISSFGLQASDHILTNKTNIEPMSKSCENFEILFDNFMSCQPNLKMDIGEIIQETSDDIAVTNTKMKMSNKDCLGNIHLNTPFFNTVENFPLGSSCKNESSVNNFIYRNNDFTTINEIERPENDSCAFDNNDIIDNEIKYLNIENFNFPSTSNTSQNNIYSTVPEKNNFFAANNTCIQFDDKVNCLEKRFQESSVITNVNAFQESYDYFLNDQNLEVQKIDMNINSKKHANKINDDIITMVSGMFPFVSLSYIKKLKSAAESSLPNEHAVCDYLVDILLKENNETPKNDLPNTSAANTSDNMDVEIINLDSNSSDNMNSSSINQFSLLENDEFDESLNVSESEPKPEKICTSNNFFTHNEDLCIKKNIPNSNLAPLVATLLRLFPSAEPQYLKRICLNKENSHQNINELTSFLLENDYPKRSIEFVDDTEIDEEEQYKMILEVLPDADPSFLRLKCSEFYREPEVLKQFVNILLETKRYPTLKDFQRRQKISAQQKQYTTEFSVEKYLDVIPDPLKYFDDPNRTQPQLSGFDKLYLTEHFKNYFNNIRVTDIIRNLKMFNYNATFAYRNLTASKCFMKTKRKPKRLPDYTEDNILLLQELAYLQHQDEIKRFIALKAVEKKEAREIAKLKGEMKTCECCYDEEIMPEDSRICSEGHVFCTECIIRSIEVAIGDNKTNFPCLAECKTEFSLQVLKDLLKPNIFSKLAQRKMLEEIKAAGIEELESCPFCDFATIPAPGDKVFRCLNNDCMRESCRLCHEPSHIPYRCEEIEKPDEVKARIYIEDKMTEALLRKCWKCGTKFIKETGCNKMTCSCGAMMCYVCSQPVKNYDHFNGQGGLRMDLCPLYSDTNKLHLENIKLMAAAAKQEIKNNNPGIELKYDPSKDLPEPPKEDKIYKPGNLYVVEEHIREIENNERIQLNNHNRRHFHNNRNYPNGRR